ncbi:MAG: ChaN family lipoprotein, partial [Bdellovibrionales bacterium]|nr:ChaN family lipoprotein [Bdellovibrionales bacterium]NQZ20136.1 ChaN family lipoprotein [Bdellovibrionales bacterium]
NYTVQDALDDYLKGDITEDEFKAAINWGGNPFEHYKQQILLPLEVMGWSHALNAPRELTRAIAREGLENISDDLKALMPPDFELGSDIYEKRFYEIMGVVHGNTAPDFVVNMFAAQCTWDDTMAWKAVEKFNTNPQQIMVIIVGNFHARYAGGLADRLQARGFENIMTIVQVQNEGLSDQERVDLAEPHVDYGVIADYLW